MINAPTAAVNGRPDDEPEIPPPAHLAPQAERLADLPRLPNGRPLVPARNWWPISPRFREMLDDENLVTRGEVKVIVARLTRRIAELEEQRAGGGDA